MKFCFRRIFQFSEQILNNCAISSELVEYLLGKLKYSTKAKFHMDFTCLLEKAQCVQMTWVSQLFYGFGFSPEFDIHLSNSGHFEVDREAYKKHMKPKNSNLYFHCLVYIFDLCCLLPMLLCSFFSKIFTHPDGDLNTGHLGDSPVSYPLDHLSTVIHWSI